MKKSTLLKKGDTFGRLTVINLAYKRQYVSPSCKKETHEYYNCICSCGNKLVVCKTSLKNGNTKSCGCLKNEVISTHKKTKTRLYRIWMSMKRRCFNSNDFHHYKNYGARGITICNEWKNNFIVFYSWALSNGYKDNLTIDRIDVNGNYEPNNCRWSTIKEQERNRRNNRFITHKGETHCVSEWAEITGIKAATIRSRLFMGWPIHRTLNDTAKEFLK